MSCSTPTPGSAAQGRSCRTRPVRRSAASSPDRRRRKPRSSSSKPPPRSSSTLRPRSRRPAMSVPTSRKPWQERWAGLLFVAPFLLLFAVFLIWPTISGLWNSFFNTSLAGVGQEFLGLQNWREMFGDSAVWTSLKNTLVFTAMSTPPLVLIALVMALLANRTGLLGWLLRFAYFAPFVLPATVVTLIWVWIYEPG